MQYYTLLFLTFLFVPSNTKSIGDSDRIVIKRATLDENFPDWVPFKNKHGDELGEFTDVELKKPKKRLALPKNFVLRAVAEADTDDYYDKGQGDSDADDYEKREMADLSRTPQKDWADLQKHQKSLDDSGKHTANLDNSEPKLTGLADIEGDSKTIRRNINSDGVLITTTETPKPKETISKKIAPKRYEDYQDYEEPNPEVNSSSAEKTKSESNDEESENETKKSNILDSVDELKEKHAQEQKAISEKLKEEAIYKDDRDFGSIENEDKYGRSKKKPLNDYEDYDDKEPSLMDKYKMNPIKKPKPTTTTTTTPQPAPRRRKERIIKDETEGNGKLSVFKNPSVYMVYDDDEGGDVVTTKRSKKRQKWTASTTIPTPSMTTQTTNVGLYTYSSTDPVEWEDNDRISLVPKDSEKDGEPTLFFPKKRKNKRRNKNKSQTPKLEPDSFVAETHDLVPLKTAYKPSNSEETGQGTGPETLQSSNENMKESSESSSSEQITTKKPNHTVRTTSNSAEVTSSSSESKSLESESKENLRDAPVKSLTGPDSLGAKPPKSLEPSSVPGGSAPSSPSEPGLSSPSVSFSSSGASAPSAVSSPSEVSAVSAPSAPSSPSESLSGQGRTSEAPLKPTTTNKLSIISPAPLWASTVADDVQAASSELEHLKEEKKNDHHEYEKGGGHEHKSEHESSHGESGKKAYEGEHKNKKTSKGHHDKQDHLGSYKDHGGFDKHHHDEKKHYGDHHHEEHGKKHAEYEESGKHSKGHSTKGSHDIHKKDEYEKKVEFFEEEGDSAEEEKHGGHTEERGHHKGGEFKKGNHNAGYHDHAKGDSGHYNKGARQHLHGGKILSSGHDSHGKRGATRFTSGANEGGKKWIYHHGYPAKNANLVVIDRRTDQFYHGPQYYG